MKLSTRLLAALTAVVFLLPALRAQDAGPLTVIVLSGEGANNTAGRGGSAPLRVKVQTAAGQPVAKALVSFSTPDMGAGGLFLGSLKRLQVTTASDGVATASGFEANGATGAFKIDVTALAGSQTGYAVIHETNVPRSGRVSRRAWYITAAVVVAAGAAGGSYAAFHHGSGNSTSISSGGVTVGAPH